MKYIPIIIPFLLGIIVVVIFDFYPRHQAANAKQNWSKESAVIIHNELVPSVFGDGTYNNNVSYKYKWKGQEFVGHEVAFGGRVPVLGENISAGYSMPCYINPDNPVESVLFVDFLPTPALFFGYGFIVVGVICALLWLIELFRHKPGTSKNKAYKGPGFSDITTTPLGNRHCVRSGNFGLYKMRTNDNICIISPSIRYYVFGLLFIIGGSYLVWDAYGHEGADILLYIGLGITLIGLFILWCAKKIIFDNNVSMFCISSYWLPIYKKRIKYSDIRAIQLLCYYAGDSEGTGYYTFEMNLVLHDSSRFFIVGWHTPKQARENAKKIAQQIGDVPILVSRLRIC